MKLAQLTRGAAWDLNQLRNGGPTAQAFTDCLIGVKIKEVITILKSCRSCHCLDGDMMCHEVSCRYKQTSKQINKQINKQVNK